MGRTFAILGGFTREFRPVASVLRMRRTMWRNGHPCYAGRVFGVDVIGIISGLGAERAESAAETAIGAFSPAGVISMGFSGSLRKEIGVGDLIIAETVGTGTGLERVTIGCDQRLVDAARRAGIHSGLRTHVGPVTSAPSVLRTAEAKRAVGKETGAMAVDMESWAAGRASSRHRIPYLAIRAVSDSVEADFDFDPEDWIAPDGSLRLGRGMVSLLRCPKSMSGLIRMGNGSRRASRSLVLMAEELFQILGGQANA